MRLVEDNEWSVTCQSEAFIHNSFFSCNALIKVLRFNMQFTGIDGGQTGKKVNKRVDKRRRPHVI